MNNLAAITQPVRRFVDAIPMYRIVLYGLLALVATSLLLSAFSILSYSSFSTLILMLLLIGTVAFVANIGMAKVFGVTPNQESAQITTYILFFVLAAPTGTLGWVGIALAAFAAIASKYLITWRSAHIFNPAAFGVLAVSLIGVGTGAWWIADQALFIPAVLVGLLILYKLRRFELFFAFLVPAVFLLLLRSINDTPFVEALTGILTLYPLVFLGTVMLTEPHTIPIKRFDRIVFAGIVAVLFVSTFDLGLITASPHLALLVGNLYAFVVSNRASTTLKLVAKEKLTPTTYAFRFKPTSAFPYKAGQYMEVTVPGIGQNSRGNRRSFSIASSPGSELIEIGVKFYEPGSAFKAKLQTLQTGDTISASNVAGEFVLPTSSSTSVVFVAGGIGITPFISMMKEMLSTDIKQPLARPVTLYYFVPDQAEVAYSDLLKKATARGIKVNIRYGKNEPLTDADIAEHSTADFYLSGPPGLVNAYQEKLKAAKIQKIHVDYFTGY